MEHIRLETIKSLEEQRALHLNHVDEIKAEAENRLSSVQCKLETQLSLQKVTIHQKSRDGKITYFPKINVKTKYLQKGENHIFAEN